jgi:kynurenine formamidase
MNDRNASPMRTIATKAEMRALFDRVSNWGRFGTKDERGTLNYLTAKKTAAAARLVKSGQSISCARNFPVHPGPENPTPALHHIVMGGDDPCAHGIPGMEVSLDFIGIAYHGLASSHIDALCHVFFEGKMYNGFPAQDVRSTGARRNSIMAARDGLVGRGVLLDIPRLRGTKFVDPKSPVTAAELSAAEEKQKVRVGEGDLLLVSVGRDACRASSNSPPGQMPPLAGLAPDCIDWLFERRVAVLGSDAVHDPTPSPAPIEDWPIPVHMCGLVSMGLHLLDNLALVELEEACAGEKRWEFLLTVAPLRVEKGTGSPVNPIAVL